MSKYGYFTQDGMEYVITRPDTPAPWVNYLTNKHYHAMITNAGGGYSFFQSPKDSRITRWRYNGLPWDRPGKYVYLRDAEDGEFWSLSWQPTPKKLDSYECRHGLGYTSITEEYKGIRSNITYFIPLQDDLEIWRVSLTNQTDKVRKLSIFSYVELCLGHGLVDLINQPNDKHFNDVQFHQDDNTLYATKRYWVTYSGVTVKQPNKPWNKWVFFSNTLPVTGFDGYKDTFIGKWRSEQDPIAIEEGKCFNTEITAGDAIGAIQNEITLNPGQTIDFAVVLGIVDKLEELSTGQKGDLSEKSFRTLARPLVQKYTNVANADNELAKLKAWWKDYLQRAQVETPDPEFNLMMNVWNQYQNKTTFDFSRNASYHHGGLLFGRGYRDSCQDMLGPVMYEPENVKERILEMGRHQFKNGSVLHCFFPLTSGGERTGHSDTPLWFPVACCQYIKETGDWTILGEVLPFKIEEPPYREETKSKATIFRHLCNNLDYVIGDCTERGLPKFGPGDWNDTLDYLGRDGKGETTWVALYLAYALKETIGMMEMMVQKGIKKGVRGIVLEDKLAYYKDQYAKLSERINRICWDGEWYWRGTNDIGEIIGSAKCEEGKIFANAQSWAVISEVADKTRSVQCMDSVKKHLDTPKGPKLLHPAYSKVNPRIGLATRCVQGKKENAAVFNHPVTWCILAETLLGRGDMAFEYFKKALPPALQNHAKDLGQTLPGLAQTQWGMFDPADEDRYEVEPYVYAEYVTSPDHPTIGQASHSWLTGTAAWMLHDGLCFICGVRAEYEGLRIDPCIPKAWDGFKFKRVFRGIKYDISVTNPNHVSKGVKSVTVDGIPIEGNLIPLYKKNSKHKVEVVMG